MKFGLLIEFDFLEAETSTKTKPEVVFRGRGRHLEMDMTLYFRNGCADLDEIR